MLSDSVRARLTERLAPLTVQADRLLGPLTTFRIGGPADLVVTARTADELIQAVTAARELEVPYFVFGRGANLLVGDGGFRGLVFL